MSELIWYPQRGYGKALTEEIFPYEKDYWEEFRAKQETPVGKILTEVRKALVEGHLKARTGLVDIGIGGGAFVEAAGCIGFDVNEIAMEWLGPERRWNYEPIGAMTFWDSLEHVPAPGEYLTKCERLAFISTPIFKDAEHCLHSKHLKMPEHLWYFTEPGLFRYMAEKGFAVIEATNTELSVGREDIGTYVFQRVCYP